MNARASVLVAVGLLVLAASCALASASSTLTVPAQPQGERTDGATVWFQGYLADSVTADPLTGSYNVVAAIYTLESGGAPVWGPETHNGTQVLEGWFHIELGSIVTPFLSFSLPPYYLQLTVNGEVLSPRQKLASVPSAMRLSGTARVTAFEMPTDAVAGRVLTSDASGNGTWQAAPGTVGGSGTIGYVPRFSAATTLVNSGIYDNGASVGIGTTSPGARLAVQGSSSGALVDVVSTYSGQQPYVMKVERTNVGASFDDVLRVQAPTTLGSQEYLFACRNGSGTAVFHVDGAGYMIASGGGTFGEPGVLAYGGTTAGTFFASEASSDTKALIGEFSSNAHVDAVGVYGLGYPADFYGVGGRFQGGWIGVQGLVYPVGASWYNAVRAEATGGSGTNYAVYADASGSGANYGIWARGAGGSVNYAGYFDGVVHATGGFSGPKAGMKIDDPLDPANKYLSHAFVGSSELMNIYSGNVVLDGAGAARVELPDWFEALNQDFRYQLTCIGAFAPVYVAEKIGGGSFGIAGGTPGMEVSWQVAAIRHDPVSLTERTDVVQEKPAREVGKYLDPEAYGMPASAGVGYVEEKEGGR